MFSLLHIVYKILLFILLLVLLIFKGHAQELSTSASRSTAKDSTRLDTVQTPVPLGSIMEKTAPALPEFAMKKSPWSAMWRSMILPGWGQYYNEAYWKVPLFVGTTGFLLYRIIDNQNLFVKYRDAGDITRREFYRDIRDEAGFYLLGVYVISIIDAYAGAHLFDFDVSEEGKTKMMLMPARNGLGLSLQW